MIKASVTVEGVVQIQGDLKNPTHREEIMKTFAVFAQRVRSDAINSMRRSSPSGRTYKVKGKRKKAIEHRASAPGQPPAVQSGRLWNSITVALNSANLTAEVGPTVFYGAFLEQGTANMDPRPFMGPALDKNLGPLTKSLQDALNRSRP